MMGYGYGWGALGILYMLVPLLILGAIIYWAVRAATQGNFPHGQLEQRPVEIAEERYARGEITFEELEVIRKNLRKR